MLLLLLLLLSMQIINSHFPPSSSPPSLFSSLQQEWIGKNYQQQGALGNDANKTNVPSIRLAYRQANLARMRRHFQKLKETHDEEGDLSQVREREKEGERGGEGEREGKGKRKRREEEKKRKGKGKGEEVYF